MSAKRSCTILMVESDHEAGDRMGSWLEESGFDVLVCTGPAAPDYMCIAGRGKPCPLVGVADVVVLDLCLPGDDVMAGTTGLDLLSYYVGCSKPVIALVPPGQRISPFEDAVLSLVRPPSREELVATVRLVSSRVSV